MPVKHQEESEKWPKWTKPPYKTNHFNCHLNSYYLWSQNAEFPNSWGHHFRWLHISAPGRVAVSPFKLLTSETSASSPRLALAWKRSKVKRKRITRSPATKLDTKAVRNLEDAGCWMLERDHDDHNHVKSKSIDWWMTRSVYSSVRTWIRLRWLSMTFLNW